MDQLKDIVRNHRRISKLNRIELATLAGVGKTAVFDIEHGKESVRFDTLKKVLHALNIQISFDSPVLERQSRATRSSGS
jgi:HTH-type transcriptional regulator/antitoxin HipB